MDIIAFFLIAWAFKHAWDHSRGDYQKSKAAHRQKQPAKQKRAAELVHHDIGYWAHQGTHGFPAFRHGFGKGWHEARQNAAKSRTERERAKTEHWETVADLEPEVAGHKRRQEKARERIREARQPEEGSGEGAVPGSGWTVIRRVGGYSTHVPVDEGVTESREAAEEYAKEMSRDGTRYEVRPMGAGPGATVAAYLNGERAAGEGSGEGSPEVQPDAAPPEDQPVQQEQPAPQERQAPQETPSQGDPAMAAAADTTYDGVLSSMAAAQNVAEGHAAETQQASRQAAAMSDEMQALEVDPATLSAMADHLDAHEAAVKAQQRVQETAEAVVATLKRGHKDLAEAHQNAPVEAAEKQFYAA